MISDQRNSKNNQAKGGVISMEYTIFIFWNCFVIVGFFAGIKMIHNEIKRFFDDFNW